MSRFSPYASIEKRTFESALVHLLETEYALLGGRRILQLIAADVKQLVEQFYPDTHAAHSGSLVWTCTADEGKKAVPGKYTAEYRSVTLVLPLVTPEDLRDRTDKQVAPNRKLASANERDQRRAVRLIKSAAEQGGLLTLAELSVILNKSYDSTRKLVHAHETETGELLPLKGYRMDQGCRPTHKGEIVRLSEQGLAPPAIARETRHNLKSVEHYLKDYERVKLLLKHGTPLGEIGAMIGRGQRVVQEYAQIIRQYHPELLPPI